MAPWYISASPAYGQNETPSFAFGGPDWLAQRSRTFLAFPACAVAAEIIRIKQQVRSSVFFTVLAFAVWVSQFWSWRRIAAFWASVVGFFLLHSLSVWAYSTFVQPILVWQWGVVLALESFIAVAFIDRFTRWLSSAAASTPD